MLSKGDPIYSPRQNPMENNTHLWYSNTYLQRNIPMNLIDIIKTWVADYPTWKVLIGHKMVHFFGNGLLGIVLGYTGLKPLIALTILLTTSIGKEISDHYRSYDNTADKEKGEDPYRYDAAFSSHVIDIIITLIGGCCGLFIAAHLNHIQFIGTISLSGLLTLTGLALAAHD